MNDQISLEDVNAEYKAFVDKFKPKKTTDDCYTPDNVYNAVLEWVKKEYGICDQTPIIRPFWPGADYEREEYPAGCVVVDNPPFSIISKICRNYVESGIKFFLFAPHLTNFCSQAQGICHVITGTRIIYENGAEVNTSFLTNMDTCEIRTVPRLAKAIEEANKKNRRQAKKQLPKYSYPNNVLTATMMEYIGKHGIELKIRHEDCKFIRALDSQKAVGKGIFGAGYLLSRKAAAEKAAAEKAAEEKAAAEKAAVEVWELSHREIEIINGLGDLEKRKN